MRGIKQVSLVFLCVLAAAVVLWKVSDEVRAGDFTIGGSGEKVSFGADTVLVDTTAAGIFIAADPWGDIRAFGAVSGGDSSVNNTAFQNAIDSGYDVLIPSGTFDVTGGITLRAGIKIRGTGLQSVINNTKDTNTFEYVGAASIAGISLIDFKITQSDSTLYGVYLKPPNDSYIVTDVKIDGVHIYGGEGGIYIEEAYRSVIRNCYIRHHSPSGNNPDYGIVLDKTSNANRIENNWISTCMNTGILLRGASGNTITGGAVQTCSTGVALIDSGTTGSSVNLIDNVWFENNPGLADVYIDGGYSESNTVRDCRRMSTGATHSVLIDSSNYNQIIGVGAPSGAFPGVTVQETSLMTTISGILTAGTGDMDSSITDQGTNTFISHIRGRTHNTSTLSRHEQFKMPDYDKIAFGSSTGQDANDIALSWEDSSGYFWINAPSGDIEITADVVDFSSTATIQVLFPLQDDATTPTIGFGDGGTGIFESGTDTISLAFDGYERWNITDGYLGSQSTAGGMLKREAATETLPGLTFTGDLDTGVGKAAADQLSLISGGVEALRLEETGGVIKLVGSAGIRGTDSFTTSATSDTVEISGVTASSIFTVSINDATPVADDLLSWTATTDTLFVHRVAGTTSGLAYSYIRID